MMMKTATIYIKVGQRLKFLRIQRGLSQEQLALEADIHRTYLGVIERGQKRVSLVALEKLAIVLKVNIAEFFQF